MGKKIITSVCFICNKEFQYQRNHAYQINTTCGSKNCIDRARKCVTKISGPWRKTNSIRNKLFFN